jgi:hypothetical protein
MLTLVLLILFTSIQVPVYAQGISVYVYGENVPFTNNPIVSDNRTLVPLREICNAMGAEVVWDAKNQSITLTKDGITNTLFINKKIANKKINGQIETITLDVPPKVVNNVTFVPLRYISESFDIKVAWNQAVQAAYIGEYDVPGKGEFAGYNKLLNHQFEEDYDVYFKVEQTGSSSSIDIKKVKLKSPDLKQYITYTYLDGTSHTLTRGQWYQYFNILSESDILHDVIRRKYGELYNEWVLNYGDTAVDTNTEKYIDKKYLNIKPANRFDLANMKLIKEWCEESDLNKEGILLDYSNFKARTDYNSGSWVLLVSGSILLKDKNTDRTIQELTFDDSLIETRDGSNFYYEVKKNNITIRLKLGESISSARYIAEFYGADLLKLGIIK